MKKRIFWGIFFGFLAMSLWQGWKMCSYVISGGSNGYKDDKEVCIGGKLRIYACSYNDCIEQCGSCSWVAKRHPFTGNIMKCGLAKSADKIKNSKEYKLREIGEALADRDCEKAAELWHDDPQTYFGVTVYYENLQMPLLYYIIDYTEQCLPEVYAEDVDLSTIRYQGKTPFEYVLYYNRNALYNDKEEALKIMLLQKKELSEKDKDVAMVVDSVIRFDKTEMFEWLLDKGLSPTSVNKDGQSLLLRTAGMNRKGMAGLLMKKGVKPDENTPDKSRENIIAIARKYQRQRQRNIAAQINQRINDTPPLVYAITFKKEDVAKLLIEHGADVNACDHIGRTVLQLAVLHGEYEIAALLIEHGADVNGKGNNRNSDTSLMSAPFAAIGMAELLIENGADVNARNSYGSTPLLHATTFQSMFMKKGYIQLVELLLKHGAEVNVKDNYGHTPLKTAEENGYDEIAELLRQHGAKE